MFGQLECCKKWIKFDNKILDQSQEGQESLDESESEELKKRMMYLLEKEYQAKKNWRKLLFRLKLQVVCKFSSDFEHLKNDSDMELY